MFCLLILALVTRPCYPCNSNCWFALDNRTGGHESATLWDKTEAGIPQQAVVTVNGTFSLDRCGVKKYEFLKFISWDDSSNKELFSSWRVLVFKLEQGKWTLHGDEDSSTVVGMHEFDEEWQRDDGLMTIQVSSMADSYYGIWLNNQSAHYDYIENWNFYKDHRLDSVNSIEADHTCAQYQYIMVCNDTVPRLCDTEPTPDKPVLGQDYTFNCTGTGSPVLESNWSVSYDDQLSSSTTLRPNAQITTHSPRPDLITSTLRVTNFSVLDIGAYTCYISNQHYGQATSKTYTLTYTAPLSSTPPNSTIYSAQDTPLIWRLSGWPLAHVNLTCSYNSSEITLSMLLEYAPPSKTFLIPTIYTELSCTLSNTTQTITTLQFNRIGYNCDIGYYGVVNGTELVCDLCPTGTTAPIRSEGSSSCQALRSSCKAGQYGANCLRCPGNMTSLPGSVKVEECYREGGEKAWFVYGVLAGGGAVGLLSVVVIVLVCKTREGVEWQYPKKAKGCEENGKVEDVPLAKEGVAMETVDLDSTMD